MSEEERKLKIQEMRKRLKKVPASVQLQNLKWALLHCHKCDGEVEWNAETCEHCGEELM